MWRMATSQLRMRLIRRVTALLVLSALGAGGLALLTGHAALVVLAISLGVISAPALIVLGLLDGWFLERRTLATIADQLSPYMRIRKPAGTGPFPVVLQFHGCGGQTGPNGARQPIMDEYADALAARGIAVIIVESLEPRRIDRRAALCQVCTGLRLRGAERSGDVLAAIRYAKSLPWVDFQRIGLAGWSHGAWSIMDLFSLDLGRQNPHGVRDSAASDLAGVTAFYATYPYCGFPARTTEEGWRHTPDTRIVMAGQDTLALETDTRRAMEAARRSGAHVNEVVISSVTHAFDEAEPDPDSTFTADRGAATQARAAYAAWFVEQLAITPPVVLHSGLAPSSRSKAA